METRSFVISHKKNTFLFILFHKLLDSHLNHRINWEVMLKTFFF